MSVVNTDTAQKAAAGFGSLPITRQLGLLVGIGLSVALGVSVVLWSREPNYTPIYNNISSPEASEIIDVLQKTDLHYKLDNQTGMILVPSVDIAKVRMKLAAEGLPRSQGQVLDILGKENGLMSSQFMEAARYKHALEADLGNTIANFANVKAARVHLALPKQSVFVRDARKATASIFLDLYGGSRLSASQVSSIVHLVASSIPDLNANDVTVVDQTGHLLTDGNGDDKLAMADRQLNYKQQVEESYSKKIDEILAPLVGVGKIKARVSADIDFTTLEETQESFNPKTVLRSEQTLEEERVGTPPVGGIPGVMSNKPPAESPEETKDKAAAALKKKAPTTDSRRQATKNYELDKTISHKEEHTGKIQRLTVAVVVDDNTITDPKTGKVTSTPIAKEQIDKFTTLIKDAIGFNAKRGDSVNVINSAFAKPEVIADIPEPSFWQKAWVWDVIKQVVGGLFVILMIFGVLRPLLRNLANRPVPEALPQPNGKSNTIEAGTLDGRLLGPLQSFDDRMQVVQNLAEKDPKRVAHVVKSWVDKT
jgi:flagellar M-ring protein FliF